MQATETLIDGDTGETIAPEDYSCEQFARCTNVATCFVSHPILEWVPTCDRCLAKLEAIG